MYMDFLQASSSLDLRENHLPSNVTKQPIDVLCHHLLVNLVNTQLDAIFL
jgi:hypothetical protein